MELTNYKITAHAATRYSERIMSNETANEINRFIVENEEKIKTDINKMITYGTRIFSGRQQMRDGKKGNVIDVFVKDTWIILVDPKTENVITLYKVDLHCGDEFNLQYISRMLEQITLGQAAIQEAKEKVGSESKMYQDLIDDGDNQIREYKVMIKNLDEMKSAYQTIIENNNVEVAKHEKHVAELVNKLVGRKEF